MLGSVRIELELKWTEDAKSNLSVFAPPFLGEEKNISLEFFFSLESEKNDGCFDSNVTSLRNNENNEKAKGDWDESPKVSIYRFRVVKYWDVHGT